MATVWCLASIVVRPTGTEAIKETARVAIVMARGTDGDR